MSNDPGEVLDALERAQDAFEGVGLGIPPVEDGIAEGGGWETQLTKGCTLLEVVDVLRVENGYYTAVIELSFGAIERSIEAYLVRMAGHDVEDFRDHEQSYVRADQSGLFEAETAEAMVELYRENRTESYYGGGRSTEPQADAMADLAHWVHEYVVDQIREGGVCVCE